MKLSELHSLIEEQKRKEELLKILRERFTTKKPEVKKEEQETEEETTEEAPTPTLEETVTTSPTTQEEQSQQTATEYTPLDPPSSITYLKPSVSDTYSVINNPSINHLANTFIKEGLLHPDQAVNAAQSEAIFKRLQELNPGATIEKIIAYHEALTKGAQKRDHGNIR